MAQRREFTASHDGIFALKTTPSGSVKSARRAWQAICTQPCDDRPAGCLSLKKISRHPVGRTDPINAMTLAKTVLVVSDRPEQFELAAGSLQRAGFRIRYRRNLVESVTLALVENPAVIISELAVPDVDGLQLCRSIRRALPSNPPIVLVGDLSKESPIVSDALMCGATDYIERRFIYAHLLRLVESIAPPAAVTGPLPSNETLFDAFIENISDSVMIADQNGLILFASPSTGRILQYRSEELTGACFFDRIHSDDLARVRAYFDNAVFGTAGGERISYRIRTYDDRFKTIQTVGRPAYDERFGWVVVLTSRALGSLASGSNPRRVREPGHSPLSVLDAWIIDISLMSEN